MLLNHTIIVNNIENKKRYMVNIVFLVFLNVKYSRQVDILGDLKKVPSASKKKFAWCWWNLAKASDEKSFFLALILYP